MLKATLGAGTG